MRYNLYRSAQLNGSAAPGYSSAQAMKALEEVFAQTMPAEMGYDYMGMSFQEKKAREGVSASLIFGFSLLFVFVMAPETMGRPLEAIRVGTLNGATFLGRADRTGSIAVGKDADLVVVISDPASPR